MSRIRFFTLTFLLLAAVVSGSAEAIDYVVSFTDGSNRVGYFVLKFNGTSFQALPPVFITASVRIGTTTPYKLNNELLVHHTFQAANGTPTYGVAVFDFLASRLNQLLPFQNFKIAAFYPQRVYGTQLGNALSPMGSPPRTMYSRTVNDPGSALLSGSGTPAGGKKLVFNNPAASDTLYGADISKDGNWAVQSITKSQGSLRVSQLQMRRISQGGGSGPVVVIPLGINAYTPSISGPITTPNGPIRWIGFRVFQNSGTSNQQSSALIGQINDNTGQTIAATLRPVYGFVRAPQGLTESFPSVLVAPDGNFVIYTAYNNSCKKQILLLQRINPLTGNRIGGKKTLIGCNNLTNILIGLYGIDIIRIS